MLDKIPGVVLVLARRSEIMMRAFIFFVSGFLSHSFPLFFRSPFTLSDLLAPYD